MTVRTVLGAITVAAVVALVTGAWLGLIRLPEPDVRPQPFAVATAAGLVELTAHLGVEPNQAVLILINRGDRVVSLDVVPGLTLLSLDSRLPDLVATGPGPMLLVDDGDPRGRPERVAGPAPAVLGPDERLVMAVSTLSLEFGRQGHRPGAPLQVGEVCPLFSELLSVVARVTPEAERDRVQLAVWALSDRIDRSHLEHLSVRELFDIWFWLEQAGIGVERLPLFAGLSDRAGEPGKLVVAGPLAARLWSLRRVNVGDPARGYQFLEADLTVACRGGEPVVIQLSQFSVRSDQGSELGQAWSDGFPTELRLLSGESYRGSLLFEVPVRDRGWVLRYGMDDTYFQCRGE